MIAKMASKIPASGAIARTHESSTELGTIRNLKSLYDYSKRTAEIIKAQISGELAQDDLASYPQEKALFPKMYDQQSS
jgi:hypothetical protein